MGLDSYDLQTIRDESNNIKHEIETVKENLKETNNILNLILNELIKLNIRK